MCRQLTSSVSSSPSSARRPRCAPSTPPVSLLASLLPSFPLDRRASFALLTQSGVADPFHIALSDPPSLRTAFSSLSFAHCNVGHSSLPSFRFTPPAFVFPSTSLAVRPPSSLRVVCQLLQLTLRPHRLEQSEKNAAAFFLHQLPPLCRSLLRSCSLPARELTERRRNTLSPPLRTQIASRNSAPTASLPPPPPPSDFSLSFLHFTSLHFISSFSNSTNNASCPGPSSASASSPASRSRESSLPVRPLSSFSRFLPPTTLGSSTAEGEWGRRVIRCIGEQLRWR
jgi:hypothetical protein